MFRRFLFAALAVGLAAGFISLGSALFTDTQSVGANTFTTGTVDISTVPTTTVVSFSNMAPGDAVTAPIVVTNGGSLALRYAITSLADNTDSKGLNGQLVLVIKTGVAACNNVDYVTDGTVLYTGPIGTAVSATALVGDPTTGSDAGDRALPPTALNTETLCFHVSLPIGSANSFQGATTTATFNFVAEQTKNN